MPFATRKLARFHNAILAALLASAPLVVAARNDPHPSEDATAASQYHRLNISKDFKAIPEGEYKLDPHHTSVTAKLAHMGLSHYTLRFDAVMGHVAFKPARATASDLEISIDPNSVDTGDKAFDKKIARTYFEADKYPSIAFDSATVKMSGNTLLVKGILNFHGVKKPVVLNVSNYGFAQSRLGFSGHATFKRSDFGVGEWIPLEADDVTILVEAEFVKA